MIDKYAIIHHCAEIGKNVSIGPFTIIGHGVEIGDNTHIGPHVVIKGPTKIGKGNKIFQFASVGEDPQDKKYQGEQTFLEIGDENIIREFCTINRGTSQDKGVTRIGNDNLFMNYVHIAHDCVIADHVILANNATLAGHVDIENYVNVSGFAAVYQFCHLGEHSFVAGGSLVTKDVLPYTKVFGKEDFAKPYGLNTVGLRRFGFSEEKISQLKRAYKIIYRQGLNINEAIAELTPMVSQCKEIQRFIDMLESAMHGIVR